MTDNTQQLNETLAASFLLVDITIHSWTPAKTDKAASQEFTASKGVSERAARVVKYLLAGADTELKAVTQMASAMRAFVYQNTLPWSISTGVKRGDRIIASSKAMTFLVDLRNLKREYDAAVTQLVAAWGQAVQTARQNLGPLFDATEYPDASEIPQLFMVNVDLKPVPAVTDYSRCPSLPPALAESLAQRYAEIERASYQNAMADLQQQITEELQRISAQLGKHGQGEKTRLYDTLVTNMQRLVGLAKTMNVSGNPKLTELAERIEQQLLQRPVDHYRASPRLAAQAADAAKQLAVEAAMESVFQ